MNAITVFITAANGEEAKRLAKILVEARLAACVQLFPQITSIYRWQGAIQQDTEVLLLVKTVAEKFDQLSETVRANNSYEVPEILAIPAVRVSSDYLNWLRENTN